MKVIYKIAQGKPVIKELEHDIQKELRELLDNATLGRVYLDASRELVMYVDDSFMHKDLPFNFRLFTSSKNYPIQEIHGSVVVARIKITGDDYDYVDVTQNDIELFEELCGKKIGG